MKSISILLLVVLIAFSSCAQKGSSKTVIPVATGSKPSANEAVAVFGEGCFWHTEIVFQSLAGVRDAVSGYAGGNTKKPDYESVSDGNTGHAEAVEVYYDPLVISYEMLVKAFFASHDPTSVNRQGNDVGSQYRSIALYRNDSEKAILDAEVARINASKQYRNKVVTQIAPLGKFYPAESYHQEYIAHHPENSYVQHVSIPDYQSFRRSFKGPFKN